MILTHDLPSNLLGALDTETAQTESVVYSDFDLSDEHDGNLPTGMAAAVLVPLVWRTHGWQVLLTLRSKSMPTHAGQISFPGGRYQADDASLEVTALREFEEETGVPQAQVNLLGRFEQYHTVTDFRITPFVGIVKTPIVLVPDPREVEDVFEVPFTFLSQLSNFKRESGVWKNKRRFYYSIPWQDRYIWGATAGMLRALARRMDQTDRNPEC